MDSELYWLNVTNIALGVVVLICVFAIAGAVVQEITDRIRKRRSAADLDREWTREFGDHALSDPTLGITMADGGEKIAPRDAR